MSKQTNITWRDFVPPIVFKVKAILGKKVGSIELGIDTPQVLAALMVVAGMIYGVLGFAVLPRHVSNLAYYYGLGDYNPRLSDRALQSYYRYKKMQQSVPTFGKGQYILGVTDEPESQNIKQDVDMNDTQQEHVAPTHYKNLMNRADTPSVDVMAYYSYAY